MAQVRPLTVIFLTPLYFGLGSSASSLANYPAHIHHAYEHHLHYPRSPKQTILIVLVQLSYTTMFGWYASYLFVATQTIWAPIVAHAFCNVMGLPRFWGNIPGVTVWKTGVYYLCLIIGAIGFTRYIGDIMPEGLEW